MIRISRSKMHDFPNIVFFRGKRVSSDGNFLFEETNLMFAPENLGPNIIEYDEREILPFKIKEDGGIKLLFDTIQAAHGARISAMEVVLVDAPSFDLCIQYPKESFTELHLHVLRGPLKDLGEFNVLFQEVSQIDNAVIAPLDRSIVQYVRVLVSKTFLEEHSMKLSDHLARSFDPNRYVDTQVALFLLVTALPATLKIALQDE